MSDLVSYSFTDGISTISMDDGKANALSLKMLTALNTALDQAKEDRSTVVLSGRPGMFSAGFDLSSLAAGGTDAMRMLIAGFELAERLLSFPTPVVIMCGGHALAMGSFLLLSGDLRIGVEGAFKIGANEVAIGLTMPEFGVEISRQRLTPAHFNRAVINAEIFTPSGAVTAGFLDRIVPVDDLHSEAYAAAGALAKLNMPAHAATKLRARAHSLKLIRAAIEADAAALKKVMG